MTKSHFNLCSAQSGKRKWKREETSKFTGEKQINMKREENRQYKFRIEPKLLHSLTQTAHKNVFFWFLWLYFWRAFDLLDRHRLCRNKRWLEAFFFSHREMKKSYSNKKFEQNEKTLSRFSFYFSTRWLKDLHLQEKPCKWRKQLYSRTIKCNRIKTAHSIPTKGKYFSASRIRFLHFKFFFHCFSLDSFSQLICLAFASCVNLCVWRCDSLETRWIANSFDVFYFAC